MAQQPKPGNQSVRTFRHILHHLTNVGNIATQGLSRMTRNHIHLAQGIAGQNIISGVRNSSQILIYIDLPSALSAGLKFYLSANGVVLSEGDENGFIKPEFFRRGRE